MGMVVDRFVGMTHRIHHALLRFARRMLARQAGQGAARANLNQHT